MRFSFIYLLFFSLFVCAQNKQLLYNVDDLPQTLMSNPGASITFDKHIGIPLFSGFSFEAAATGISVYDVFREDRDINESIRQAIVDIDSKDYIGINQQLEIISFGWKQKFSDIYYSGGLYQEFDAIIYYPKDFLSLAVNGNVDFVNTPVNFSQVAAAAEAVTVYHFGINKKVNNKWQIGARGKIYMSIFNASSTNNRGTFTTQTTPNGPNLLRHSLQDVLLQGNTSGFTNDGGFLGRALISNNVGLGLDLGMTYFANDHWTFTGSIIDVGFIAHTNDVRNFRASGTTTFDGIEFEFPAITDDGEIIDYWEELEDQITDDIELEDDLSESFTTLRPIKINGSIQYAFGRPRSEVCNCLSNGKGPFINRVGLQLYGVGRPQGLQTAITAFYDKSWGSFLRSKVTYTTDRRSFRNIGMLLSTQIHNFNLYIAGDNLLEYSNLTKARGAGVQLGMQLVFDSK